MCGYRRESVGRAQSVTKLLFYYYGILLNEFLTAHCDAIGRRGDVLCLLEVEGRNAVCASCSVSEDVRSVSLEGPRDKIDRQCHPDCGDDHINHGTHTSQVPRWHVPDRQSLDESSISEAGGKRDGDTNQNQSHADQHREKMMSRTPRLVAQNGKKQAEALNYEPEPHQGHAASLPGQKGPFRCK